MTADALPAGAPTPTDETWLRELEARLTAITTGPWRHYTTQQFTFGGFVASCGQTSDNVRHYVFPGPIDWRPDGASADAEFIAHAPDDIRRLVTELRAAQAELAGLRSRQPTDETAHRLAELEQLLRDMFGVEDELAKAEARIAELETELAGLRSRQTRDEDGMPEIKRRMAALLIAIKHDAEWWEDPRRAFQRREFPAFHAEAAALLTELLPSKTLRAIEAALAAELLSPSTPQNEGSSQ